MWNMSSRGPAKICVAFVALLLTALTKEALARDNAKNEVNGLGRGGDHGPVGASPRPSDLNETHPDRPPFNGTRPEDRPPINGTRLDDHPPVNGTRPEHNGTFPERPPFNGTRPPCNGTGPAPGNETRPPSGGRGDGGRGRGLLGRGGDHGPVGASPRPSDLNESHPDRPPFNGTRPEDRPPFNGTRPDDHPPVNGTRPEHNGTFPERPPFNGTRPPCNGTGPAPGNDTRPPSGGRGDGGSGRGRRLLLR